MIKNKLNKILISVDISLIFIYFGVAFFPNFGCRIIEGGRDLGLSVAYYFCELFEIEHNIEVTVNTLPSLQIVKSRFQPLTLLPEDFDEFKIKCEIYFRSLFTKEYFFDYNKGVLSFIADFLQIFVFAVPFVIIAVVAFKQRLYKQNNNYNEDTKPLKLYKKIIEKIVKPIKSVIKDYGDFFKKYSFIYKSWVVVWALYFNAFAIIIEFLSYYFYFVVSFDLINLYKQVYKLFLDLTPLLRFVPAPVFVVFGIWVLNKISEAVGMNELRRRERINRGVFNTFGVSTLFYAKMGAGKTLSMTDIALSANAAMRDKAFEVILECDFKFPRFPWINLENELKREFKKHTVYDKTSCEAWVEGKERRWKKRKTQKNIFGYDFTNEPIIYNDDLKTVSIWSVIKDYSVCYLIYTVLSSYIVSNYSIRVDDIIMDLGNFPLWDSDFFARDSRYLNSFSRRSHILDYDMLRIGRKMIEDNPNGYSFGFGVYVISEIDKERKNMLELRSVKADSEETNQRNDCFNANIKMSRHACTVANRNFVTFLGDLQRCGSLGSDFTELGDLIYVAKRGEMRPVLPFYSPFYLFEIIHNVIYGKFENFYVNMRYLRGDNTLTVYLFKGLAARLQGYYTRKLNRFGSSRCVFEISNGMQTESAEKVNYFIQSKKAYSDRFCTDCQGGIYERFGKFNKVGIDDLPNYSGSRATSEELDKQNSYFQNEVRNYGSYLEENEIWK